MGSVGGLQCNAKQLPLLLIFSAVSHHFLEHVQPAHQLTFHIQLGEGRPVAEFLQPLSHGFVLQDVERLETRSCPA